MEEKDTNLTHSESTITLESDNSLTATDMVEEMDDKLSFEGENEPKEPTEEEKREEKIEFIKKMHYGNNQPKKDFGKSYKLKRKKKNKQSKKSRKANRK